MKALSQYWSPRQAVLLKAWEMEETGRHTLHRCPGMKITRLSSRSSGASLAEHTTACSTLHSRTLWNFTSLSSFAGLSFSQATCYLFRVMGPQVHLIREPPMFSSQCNCYRNYTNGNQSKDRLKVRSRQRTSPFSAWDDSAFCILHCSTCWGVFIRWLHTVLIWWKHRKAGKYVSCSEMAASSLCSPSITTSSKMPENRDLMTNFVKYAVSQEPVIVVVSKPPKKNNSRQGELILLEKNSN